LKIKIIIILSLVLILIFTLLIIINISSNSDDNIDLLGKITGIENFKIDDINGKYIIFYPKDIRISKNNTTALVLDAKKML
jgi:hypothetical protein